MDNQVPATWAEVRKAMQVEICRALWRCRWLFALWAYWLSVEIYRYWH